MSSWTGPAAALTQVWMRSPSSPCTSPVRRSRTCPARSGVRQVRQMPIRQPLGMTTARIINEADIVPNRAAGYQLVDGQLKNQDWVAPKLNTTASASGPHRATITLASARIAYISGRTVHVVEQFFKFCTDVEPIDANVLVGLAEVTGPLPGFAEHLLVQLTQEGLIEDFLALPTLS